MAFGEILSGILSGLGGLVDIGTNIFKTKYNYETNERDFDYQKSLQQQIFEREDTAVQRRMADLQAAGLNPNLAAGQGASAGAVVSRSNTNDLNVGSVLDTVQAMNQIRLQKQELQNKKVENNILENTKEKEKFEKTLDWYKMFADLGYQVEPDLYLDKDNKINFGINFTSNSFDTRGNAYTNRPFRNMVLGRLNNDYDYMMKQLDYLNKNNDYLAKELKWQTAEKFMDIARVGSNFLPGVNFSFKK